MNMSTEKKYPETKAADEDLKTEGPLSEKDEVKQAEANTGSTVKTEPDHHSPEDNKSQPKVH